MAYATVDQLKGALRLPLPDAQQTDQMTRALSSASRSIDGHCRRQFTLTVSSTRVYAAAADDLVLIEDASAVSLVETKTSPAGSWVTMPASDYQLEPLNGVSDGLAGWPYTRIRAVGGVTFPTDAWGSALVRVTATWGWATIPDEIEEATILQAVRIFKRPDAPFGVTFGELGAVSVQKGLDPDVAQLVAPYVRPGGFG